MVVLKNQEKVKPTGQSFNDKVCNINPKFAIIQRVIPHYRIDFFSRLSKIFPNMVVLHSSKITADGLLQTIDFNFPNCFISMVDKRYICYQKLILKIAKSDFELVVLGPELRIISNLIVYGLCCLQKRKVVWWTHGFDVHKRKKGFKKFFDRVFKSLMMRWAYRILLYTDYNLPELLNWGINRNKVIIVKNTLNEIPFQKALKNVSTQELAAVEHITRESNHTLAFLGRLTRMKRCELLLDLAGRLLKSYGDLRVFIIGDGPERNQLEQKTFQQRLQHHVFFWGTITTAKQLSPLMKMTDLTVHTGPVGLSIVHSMIYGIPFVTLEDENHGPEFAYLTKDYTGYAAKNIDDMFLWVEKCFSHPEKLREMSKNCLTVIEKEVNFENMISQFKDCFE